MDLVVFFACPELAQVVSGVAECVGFGGSFVSAGI